MDLAQRGLILMIFNIIHKKVDTFLLDLFWFFFLRKKIKY